MQFKDVIGQEAVKQRLIQSVLENRVSHAQLFLGQGGTGKLALALAYVQYICCADRTESDSCGICHSCQKISKLAHPDLHFVFPTATTKKVKKDPEANLFMEEWREFVLQKQAYIDTTNWFDFLEIENKQGSIFVRDAATLLHKLSLKAYEGDYKMAILWMAEKMNVQTANKLLKLLEEPPEKTLFILIAEDQEQLLTTVKSRTGLVKIPPIAQQQLQEKLMKHYNCDCQEAVDAAIMAKGSWIEACRYFENKEDEKYNFQTFQQWMRLCFRAAVPELIDFTANLKSIGREKQKGLLMYALEVFRNSLLLNNNLIDLVQLPEDEKTFSTNFSPFVKPINLLQMRDLMEEGIKHIERNGYAPIILLDISLKITKLLRM